MSRSALKSIQRAGWQAVFLLLLSMRLLTPHGFMPVWSDGHLEVQICDAAGARIEAAPSHRDHHGHGKKDGAKHRQPCPYAAASAETFLSPPAANVLIPLTFAPTAAPSVHSGNIAPQRRIERPPSRAPPPLA